MMRRTKLALAVMGFALLVSSCCKSKADSDVPPTGVFTLTGVRVEAPNRPSTPDWEVTYKPGRVEYSPSHKMSPKPGSMTLRFEWTNPPSEIAPGEVWPITGTARVVASDNPLNWAGTLDARDPEGSLFPLNSVGGSQVTVGSPSPAGHFVTLASTKKCVGGGADFELHISAPTGNKDWSADYYYQYKWNP